MMRGEQDAAEGAKLARHRLARRAPERSKTCDDGQHTEPDRQCARSVEAEIEHPVLVEPGRIVPLERPVPEHGADDHDCTDDERHEADPVPAAPALSPRSEVPGPPDEERAREQEDDRNHGELTAHEWSDQRGEHGTADPPARRRHERAQDQEERERREEVRERLLDDHRGVGDRGNRRRRRGDEERRPAPDDETCDPVRGKDGCGHHDHRQVLHGRVRGVEVVDQPRGCEHVGPERGEGVRRAAPSRVTGVGDRPGQLRQLELVAEEPRCLVSPGLDHEDDREPEEDAEQRHRGQKTVDQRLFGWRCARGHDGHRRISRR